MLILLLNVFYKKIKKKCKESMDTMYQIVMPKFK